MGWGVHLRVDSAWRVLRALLEAWFARHVDPRVDGISQGVTGLGQLRPVFPEWSRRGPAYQREE